MAVTQGQYRFGIDESTEAGHGWYAAQNANPAFGAIPLDTTFLLRFLCQCDATALSNADFEFQYRKNGGAWTQISTSSTDVRAVTPTCWANAANTTNRLTGGTGTFEASSQGCTADGISGGTAFDIVSNGFGETECAMQLRSADLVAGDFIEFRLTRDGGTLMDTYSVAPALGVPLSASITETRKIAEALVVAVAGTLFISASEPAKVATSGRVDLIGLGNPIRVVDGPPVAQLVSGSLSALVSGESFKVADTDITLRITPLQAAPSESLKISDPLTVSAGVSANLSESFKLVDTGPSLTLDPEQTTPSESLKADEGGRVDLIGLGNPIRITDGPVVAQFVGNDLTVGPSESFKVADLVSLTINPEETIRSESLKIADTVSAEIGITTSATESLKVADAPSVTLNPEEAIPSESLKISDLPSISVNPEETTPSESLEVADSVSVLLIAAGTLTADLTESAKVIDTPSVTLNPEQSGPSESLKADDGGRVDLLGLGNPIRITDGPVIAQLAGNDFSASLFESLKVADSVVVVLNPEQATPLEGLKVADQVSAAITTALSATPSESLKISDTGFVTLNPEQSSPSEIVKGDDGGFVELIGLGNPIRITDGPILAQLIGETLTASITENLKISDGGEAEISRDETIKIAEELSAAIFSGLAVNPSESLKIADSVSVAITLQASTSESLKVVDNLSIAFAGDLIATLTESLKVADSGEVELSRDETIKVSDSLSVALLDAGSLAANIDESLKVSDTVLPGLELGPVGVAEPLKIADLVTVAIERSAAASENLKITDTVTASLHLSVEVGENLRVVDEIPVGRLNPLQIQLSESAKVNDTEFAAANATTLAVIAAEPLKVADSVLGLLDPEETTFVESLKISDAALGTLNPEETALTEAVRCSDTVQVSLSVLQVNLSEGLEISESLFIGGPAIIDVVGSYSTSIESVGSYSTAIDIVGERL